MRKAGIADRARLVGLAVLTVAVIAMAGSAYAAPSTYRAELAQKQAQVDAFNAQLDDLDNQAEIASQEYNSATDQLASATKQAQDSQTDVNNARVALAVQKDILSRRAAAIYRDGTLGAVEILLDSKSVGDLVGRVKFINAVGLADANTAGSLQAQKDLMEQQLAQLQAAQSRAAQLEFEAKARKIEVDLRIQERQDMLASVQSDLRQLIDAEAARRSGEQQALLSEVLSGTNKAGIVVTPGSPVETALAYHGIPYVWGGATPSGFDCSGLMLYVFAQHGVLLPHYSGSQFLLGEKIDLANIQPNDVVFFGSPVHHVGMYAGGGYFIEAPHTGDFVKISKLAGRSDIAGVRRYPWVTRVAPIQGAKASTTDALSSVR